MKKVLNGYYLISLISCCLMSGRVSLGLPRAPSISRGLTSPNSIKSILSKAIGRKACIFSSTWDDLTDRWFSKLDAQYDKLFGTNADVYSKHTPKSGKSSGPSSEERVGKEESTRTFYQNFEESVGNDTTYHRDFEKHERNFLKTTKHLHELKLQEMKHQHELKMTELALTHKLKMDGLIVQNKLQMETNNHIFRWGMRTMNCFVIVSGITTATVAPTLHAGPQRISTARAALNLIEYHKGNKIILPALVVILLSSEMYPLLYYTLESLGGWLSVIVRWSNGMISRALKKLRWFRDRK